MRRLILLLVVLGMLISVGCRKDSLEPEESSSTGTYSENEQAITDADLNNDESHDESSDYTWNASDIDEIILNGNSITENSDGAYTSGSTLVINAAGNYSLSGSLTNGQVIVEANDEDLVRLILDEVDITSENSSPIYIKSAEKVIVVVNENTVNTITDGSSYTYDDAEKEEPNATLFSKTDLTVFGEGELNIIGNFNDAINCKDGLIIAVNQLSVTAKDDGVRGKDYLIIKEGNVTIDASDDGLKSDNDEDETRGYVKIQTGDINITAGGDAITGYTDVLIEDGSFDVTTTGVVTSTNGVSSKGIKSGVNTIINLGTFIIETTEDAIHSDQTLTLNGGNYTISADDDGIHADYDLIINGGNINITRSYEGIESAEGNMYINGGDIKIVSSDDGLNLAGGGDTMGGPGGMTNPGSSSDYTMYLQAESITINAQGDGIDANGSVEVTGGLIIVNGPTSNGNGAIDYDYSFLQNGGVLLAVGSSGMLQAPSSSSDQYAVAIIFRSFQEAGKLIHIETSGGEYLFTFKPEKQYQAVVFSSPELQNGVSYDFYTGGSVDGESSNGYFTDASYTDGSKITSFTLSKIITTVQIN